MLKDVLLYVNGYRITSTEYFSDYKCMNNILLQEEVLSQKYKKINIICQTEIDRGNTWVPSSILQQYKISPCYVSIL